MHNLVHPEIMILVSVFSLLWFILGILVADVMPRRQVKRQKGKRPSNKRRQQTGQQESGRNGGGSDSPEIYVGNLSYNISEKEITDAFETYGNVKSVRLIENKFNGKSKGFAFVEMQDASQAKAAIRAMNGKELMGRVIVANAAKSRRR